MILPSRCHLEQCGDVPGPCTLSHSFGLQLTIDIGGGQAYHLGLADTGTEIDLQSPARLGSLTKCETLVVFREHVFLMRYIQYIHTWFGHASPRRYVYDPVEDAFKSPKDGHDLIEMFSRDLVYTSKGVPLF